MRVRTSSFWKELLNKEWQVDCRFDQALHDAERACSLSPEWYKSWYRKAVALNGMKRYREAKDCCDKALKFAEDDPHGASSVKKLYDDIAKALKRRDAACLPSNRNMRRPVKMQSVPDQGRNVTLKTALMQPSNPVEVKQAHKSLEETEISGSSSSLIREIRMRFDAIEKSMLELGELIQKLEVEASSKGRIKAVHDGGDCISADEHHNGDSGDLDDDQISTCKEVRRQDSNNEERKDQCYTNDVQEHHGSLAEEQDCSGDDPGLAQHDIGIVDISSDQEGSEHTCIESCKSDCSTDCADNESDILDDILEMELLWQDTVQDARERLGADGTMGFVPAPKSRRKKSNSMEGFSAQRDKQRTGLNLDGLSSLLGGQVPERKTNLDPDGNQRYTCLDCGDECKQYANPAFGTYQDYIMLPSDALFKCDDCGCEYQVHSLIEKGKNDPSESESTPPTPCSEPIEVSERQKRVDDAHKRRSQAEEAGEPIMETDIDILAQKKRLGCTYTGCTGFKVYYQPNDTHDPNIMLYCSNCGCPADQHEVDLTFEQQEQSRKRREEEHSAARAARARRYWSRSGRKYGSSKLKDAYDVLNVPPGSSKVVITKAWKKSVLLYHPDKQPKHLMVEELLEKQQMFQKITSAYKTLIEELL